MPNANANVPRLLLDSVTDPHTRGNSDQLELVRHDRTLIRNAVEEMMRFFTITHIGRSSHANLGLGEGRCGKATQYGPVALEIAVTIIKTAHHYLRHAAQPQVDVRAG